MGKVYTLAEVSKHNDNKDCWLIIAGKVYDVTRFLDDHPGGDEVLLSTTGRDATENFEDIGHSSSAIAMMNEYYVGDIDTATIPTRRNYKLMQQPDQHNHDRPPEFTFKLLQFLIPIIIFSLALGINLYIKSLA